MSRLAERRALRYRSAEHESSDVSAPAPSDVAAESSTPEDSAAPDYEWFDMESAPKDGTALLLRDPEGRAVEARWRTPRKWDRTVFRWVVDAGWFYNFMGSSRIAFEPDAWTRSAM